MEEPKKSGSWLKRNWLMGMLVFAPIALVLEHVMHVEGIMIFITSAAAIIPLAALMGRATEQLAERLGEGIGGLLNATFGNAAELIIAIIALRAGYYDLVKASIAGSIIGNILLVFGAGALYGGLKFESQRYNPTAAALGATMLLLSAVGLVVPTMFHAIAEGVGPAPERTLSLEIAVVLFLTYLASLVFALRTHRHLYVSGVHEHDAAAEQHGSTKSALLLLLGATAGVTLMSELLVGAVESAGEAFRMNEVFMGVIVVAVIGNAAEHSTAIIMAGKNRMDAAINIAVGSSIQIALFVAPLLVFLSYVMGPQPLDLVFSNFEVLAVAVAVLIMAQISHDGESHWMEGVQLLATYVIIGLAFYFLPV